MVIAIIIIIFLFIGLIGLGEQQEQDKKNEVLFRGEGEYLGGLSDTEGGKKFTCIFDKNNIAFKGKLTMRIRISNIKNIAIKSEMQIQSDISLGKMVVFGVFALAMKNKKTVVNNYSVMNIYQHGKDQTIILRMQDNEKFVRQIQKLI